MVAAYVVISIGLQVERLFAWLPSFWRIVARHERYATNFLGMVQLACILILFKRYL